MVCHSCCQDDKSWFPPLLYTFINALFDCKVLKQEPTLCSLCPTHCKCLLASAVLVVKPPNNFE